MRHSESNTYEGMVIDIGYKISKLHKYTIVTAIIPGYAKIEKDKAVEIKQWR